MASSRTEEAWCWLWREKKRRKSQVQKRERAMDANMDCGGEVSSEGTEGRQGTAWKESHGEHRRGMAY
jgi:hypothetical protein